MTQPLRWLQDEIAARMLQKLDIVKLDVKDILVVPDFAGKHLDTLAQRYPKARIFSITEKGVSGFQMWRAKALSNWRSLFASNTSSLTSYASSGRFDIPDNSVDLVFSDLLMQHLSDPQHFLGECWRVLREGGLITFSYLGPDTGKEFFPLEVPGLKLKKLLSPWDMHDIGDALLGERFSDPVMDMEFITLDYKSDALLVIDAEALKLLNMPTSEVLKEGVLPQKMTLEPM